MNQNRMFRRWITAAGLVFVVVLGASVANAGTIVRFATNVGAFDVELYDDIAPISVTNFLSYVTAGTYTDTLIHRSPPNFVIQGGGYTKDFDAVPSNAPIPLEYTLPNERGTLAMARTQQPNTATTQWFINTGDNSASLAPNQFSAGYAVFGRVLGDGMDVVDQINALPIFNGGSPFNELPLQNFSLEDQLTDANKVIVHSISVVPEPATIFLAAAAGLGSLAIVRGSRKRRAAA